MVDEDGVKHDSALDGLTFKRPKYSATGTEKDALYAIANELADLNQAMANLTDALVRKR